MELKSTRSVPASIDATWAALNDPEALKACLPGCESIERVSDNEFRVALNARVGPVNAKFSGRIVLSDVLPPKSYKLTFEGQGGTAGFAKGQANVELSPEGDGTLLSYSANAQVGGKLAQIGSRLIDGAARKVADDFFARLAERLAAQAGVAVPVTVEPTPAAQPVWKSMWLRLVLALAIVIAVFAYWLSRQG